MSENASFSPLNSTELSDIIEYAYNAGMYYVQQGILAKQAGKEEEAQKFVEEFEKLLKDFEAGPETLPDVISQKAFEKFKIAAADYFELESALKEVQNSKGQVYRPEYNDRSEESFRTCQTLVECMQNHEPPPSLIEKPLIIRQLVQNVHIPENSIQINITQFQNSAFPNASFFLHVYKPKKGDSDAPIEKEIQCKKYTPPLAISFNLWANSIRAERLPVLKTNLLSLDLKFDILRYVPAGLLSKEKRVLVASASIGMSYFAANANFSEMVAMDFQKGAEKNEKCWLQLEILLNHPLQEDEVIENAYNLHVLSHK